MVLLESILKVKKAVKIILLVSVLLFFVSLLNKGRLPEKKEIDNQLYHDPVQTELKSFSFKKEVKGVTYDIVALFRYRLYGLVVSSENCSSWANYYNEQHRDFINLKDICVIWGENIANEVYKQMRFSSNAWSCEYSFKPGLYQKAFAQFKNYCLSNNHLLAGDEKTSKLIRDIRRGDQVYIEGYLVKYSAGHWNGWRETSTDRRDNGCEVIYVNKIVMLKKANVFWNFLYLFTKYVFFICIIISLFIFFKEPVNREGIYLG